MLCIPVLEADFKATYNIKQKSELSLGEGARQFISKAKEVNLREERVAEFYDVVRQFCKVSGFYIKDKLPLNDELPGHAQALNPANQVDTTFSSLAYFLQRFLKLLPPDATMNDIQLELSKYQSILEFSKYIRACMQNRRNLEGDQQTAGGWPTCFQVLSRVMASILTIPHSSAHCKRTFPFVRKNQTDFRGKMSTGALEALLLAKSRPGGALERGHSEAELGDLKNAYYRSLK